MRWREYWCCVNIPPRPLDGKREGKLRKGFKDQSDERKTMFFEKSVSHQMLRERIDRHKIEGRWIGIELKGEKVVYVRGVGGEDVSDSQ